MIPKPDIDKLIESLSEVGSQLMWSQVTRLAKAHVQEDPASSEAALMRSLRKWWAEKYSRPLKDPLLATYAPAELAYEFLLFYYSDPARDPRAEQKAKEDEEWAKEQARKIAEEAKKLQKQPEEEPAKDQEAKKSDPLEELAKLSMPGGALPPDLSTTFGPGPDEPKVK